MKKKKRIQQKVMTQGNFKITLKHLRFTTACATTNLKDGYKISTPQNQTISNKKNTQNKNYIVSF